MCGIGGIVTEPGKQSADISQLKRMMDVISYRGPDDSGHFVDNRVALGHRRLAILDVSSAGHQPLWFQDRYAIVYNGEIYNYVELRSELVKLGYSFVSRSDTEVLLASYAEWGESCVTKFNGMWAFAIYDVERSKLFCSRDRFGIKPFYFSQTENEFVFGSEIKQLLGFQKSVRSNYSKVLDFVLLGLSEHDNETFFENVYALGPGFNLSFDLVANQYEVEQYYQLSPKAFSSDEQYSYIEELLQSSVDLRLRSDVEVGLCLSGGLDSSAIACLAARAPNRPSDLHALTARSHDPLNDEAHFAKLVVDDACLKWTQVDCQPEGFMGLVDDVVLAQGEPFLTPSVLMQYSLFESASKLGLKVMLDGQGGDETFLGYERYYTTLIRNTEFRSVLKEMFAIVENSKLSIHQLLFYLPYFLSPFVRRAAIRSNSRWLRKGHLDNLEWGTLDSLVSAYSDPELLQRNEIRHFQLPHLLRYEDRNSMAHSIESRLPFLDYRLVEAAMAIPIEEKMGNGWTKQVLRKILDRQLPKEIVWRKQKVGFEPPRTEKDSVLQKDVDLTLKSSAHVSALTTELPRAPSARWRLYFMAKWENAFGVDVGFPG